MNVVGASETVVPHAVAEGYQRTKKNQKDTQKDMTGKKEEIMMKLFQKTISHILEIFEVSTPLHLTTQSQLSHNCIFHAARAAERETGQATESTAC